MDETFGNLDVDDLEILTAILAEVKSCDKSDGVTAFGLKHYAKKELLKRIGHKVNILTECGSKKQVTLTQKVSEIILNGETVYPSQTIKFREPKTRKEMGEMLDLLLGGKWEYDGCNHGNTVSLSYKLRHNVLAYDIIFTPWNEKKQKIGYDVWIRKKSIWKGKDNSRTY